MSLLVISNPSPAATETTVPIVCPVTPIVDTPDLVVDMDSPFP